MIPTQGTKLTLAQVDELAEPLGYLAFDLFIKEKMRREAKSARSSLERLAFLYSFSQASVDFLAKENGLVVAGENRLQPTTNKEIAAKLQYKLDHRRDKTAQWKTDKSKFGFKRK